eukprot:ANDGO_03411.mRNA.1 hypothetical protein
MFAKVCPKLVPVTVTVAVPSVEHSGAQVWEVREGPVNVIVEDADALSLVRTNETVTSVPAPLKPLHTMELWLEVQDWGLTNVIPAFDRLNVPVASPKFAPVIVTASPDVEHDPPLQVAEVMLGPS